jgi:hypothetical protein
MQKKSHSAIESVTNQVVGFGLGVLIQAYLYPLFDIHIPLSQNFLLVAIFSVVSFLRGYILRRLFNYWSHGGFKKDAVVYFTGERYGPRVGHFSHFDDNGDPWVFSAGQSSATTDCKFKVDTVVLKK